MTVTEVDRPGTRTTGVRVAGVGAVTSVGDDVRSTFDALVAGRDGLTPLRALDATRYRTTAAYEVADRPAGDDVPGRAGALLVAAVREALADAGLPSAAGVPVLVGTGLRELRSLELAWAGRCELEPDDLHFGRVLQREVGAEDVHTFANACSASLYAAGLGVDLLALGHETVVVAGVDVLTSSMFGLLDRVHVDPPDRLRPFDAQRRGVLMGEGAAAVVLTRADGGADGTPGVRLRTVALGCDAYHATAPDPAGVERTIRDAHRDAGVAPEDVDVVYAHGTGTLLNDDAEATALARVFAGTDPYVVSVKGATGHTSGGSGLLSLVLAARTLLTGELPGVTGLREPSVLADGLRLPRAAVRLARPRVAQVDAFGFGGLNAVAVLDVTP